MSKAQKSSSGVKMERPAQPKAKRSMSPERRENQLIALAYDLVEERLRNGTATSQETTHFLRLGSMKERREQLLLEKQIELMTAKTEQIQSQKRVEELYSEALNAMKSYGGENGEN